MGTMKVKDIVDVLKSIIDRNGPSYLVEEPYRVYKEVLDSRVTDEKTAAAILYVLVTPEILENMDFFVRQNLYLR